MGLVGVAQGIPATLPSVLPARMAALPGLRGRKRAAGEAGGEGPRGRCVSPPPPPGCGGTWCSRDAGPQTPPLPAQPASFARSFL